MQGHKDRSQHCNDSERPPKYQVALETAPIENEVGFERQRPEVSDQRSETTSPDRRQPTPS
jgi:hypothetical protein